MLLAGAVWEPCREHMGRTQLQAHRRGYCKQPPVSGPGQMPPKHFSTKKFRVMTEM